MTDAYKVLTLEQAQGDTSEEGSLARFMLAPQRVYIRDKHGQLQPADELLSKFDKIYFFKAGGLRKDRQARGLPKPGEIFLVMPSQLVKQAEWPVKGMPKYDMKKAVLPCDAYRTAERLIGSTPAKVVGPSNQ